jgi:hypothetical protein
MGCSTVTKKLSVSLYVCHFTDGVGQFFGSGGAHCKVRGRERNGKEAQKQQKGRNRKGRGDSKNADRDELGYSTSTSYFT